MFVLLALGSRGDVQPLATLADALIASGHEARVVALAEYRPLVSHLAPGAEFTAIDTSLGEALTRTPTQEVLSRSFGGQYLLLRRWTSAMTDSLADALVCSVHSDDMIITGVLGRGAAMACVAGLGCRMTTVVFTGQLPTTHRESFLAPQFFSGWAPYDRWGTGLSWRLSTSLGSALTTCVRRRLGLPHKGAAALTRMADKYPIILAASPLIVPPAPDWPASTRQTGYLCAPPQPWQPGTRLAEFLTRNPVFVGFGSFTRFTCEQDLTAILDTARATGYPLLTLSPSETENGHLSDDVLAIAAAPFEHLFGMVAATIHHGGAGTTHEALRSGRPSVVIPFGVDQPFHASRLHALGMGPEPGRLRRNRLDVAELTRLVTELTTGPQASQYARRARALAAISRHEDGLTQTVELLEQQI